MKNILYVGAFNAYLWLKLTIYFKSGPFFYLNVYCCTNLFLIFEMFKSKGDVCFLTNVSSFVLCLRYFLFWWCSVFVWFNKLKFISSFPVFCSSLHKTSGISCWNGLSAIGFMQTSMLPLWGVNLNAFDRKLSNIYMNLPSSPWIILKYGSMDRSTTNFGWMFFWLAK